MLLEIQQSKHGAD